MPTALLGISVFVPVASARIPLLQLSSQGKALPPAAVYTCSSINADLKCVSSVADDTAHLSENPAARILRVRGKIVVKQPRSLSPGAVSFYTADERTLLDNPKYQRLHPAGDRLDLPPTFERTILIAIYQPPGHQTKTKIVWLIGPPVPPVK